MKEKYRIYKTGCVWVFQFRAPIAVTFQTWQEAVDYFNEQVAKK